MRVKRRQWQLAVAAAGWGLVLSVGIAQAQTYELTPLVGHYDVSAINDLGQIVGNDGHYDPWYWSTTPYSWSAGVTTILGPKNYSCPDCQLPAGINSADAINNAGQITGTLTVMQADGQAISHAYRYQQGKVTDLDLGSIPAGRDNFFVSAGHGINSAGVIAGTRIGADGYSRATTFAGDSKQYLGPYYQGTSAVAINDKGQVTGNGASEPGSSTAPSAYLFDNGKFTQLGAATHSTDINASGAIVGNRDDSGAFVYKDGVMTLLGGVALAINDAGVIVGRVGPWHPYFPSSESQAVVFRDGQMLDLNTLVDSATAGGWILENAVDINNVGQIVGTGEYSVGGELTRGAFLLTPVPEPGTMILMAAGLVTLALMQRRRRVGATRQYPQRK